MNFYLGVDIHPFPDKKGFILSQPFFIDIVIQAFNFDPKTTKSAKNNTPSGYPLLNKDENGPARKASWKYRGVIGTVRSTIVDHEVFQYSISGAQSYHNHFLLLSIGII